MCTSIYAKSLRITASVAGPLTGTDGRSVTRLMANTLNLLHRTSRDIEVWECAEVLLPVGF